MLVGLYGQGIDFHHGVFDEAIEIAKTEDKLVFVDAFTTWCGPCKRMARDVFPQEEVGDFFNANFINMKIDMEKQDGLKFGQKYKVTAYPTFYFIAPDGEAVYSFKGGRDKTSFINEAKKALASYDRSGDFAEAYEKGDRDYNLVLNYVKALNQAGKPSLKVSNDYLYAQNDLTTKENLLFLHEAIIESDSRVYELYSKHKKKVLQYVSESDYQKKVMAACRSTVAKAVKYQNVSLLKNAQKQVKKHHKEESKKFKHRTNFDFAEGSNNQDKVLKTAKKNVKSGIGNDVVAANLFIKHIEHNHQPIQEMMDLAENTAKKFTKGSSDSDQWMVYARILIKNKSFETAEEVCKKAIGFAEAAGKPTKQIEGTIKYLNSLKEN